MNGWTEVGGGGGLAGRGARDLPLPLFKIGRRQLSARLPVPGDMSRQQDERSLHTHSSSVQRRGTPEYGCVEPDSTSLNMPWHVHMVYRLPKIFHTARWLCKINNIAITGEAVHLAILGQENPTML